MSVNIQITYQTGVRKVLYPLLVTLEATSGEIETIVNSQPYKLALSSDFSQFKSRCDFTLTIEAKTGAETADFLNQLQKHGVEYSAGACLKIDEVELGRQLNAAELGVYV